MGSETEQVVSLYGLDGLKKLTTDYIPQQLDKYYVGLNS